MIKYFLGTSSHTGFVSLFDEINRNSEYCYILKGSAGSGKSTLMGKLAAVLDKSGDLEYIHCSSDADSLDAIISASTGITMVDGTAPHTMDPIAPKLHEEIVWLGEFLDKKKLLEHHDEILRLMARCAEYHREAGSYLFVGGEMIKELARLCSPALDTAAVAAKARRYAARLFKKTGENAKVQRRLLTAITNRGRVSFSETVSTLCDKVYIIEDKLYCYGESFLRVIADQAKQYGLPIVISCSPYFPKTSINAVLVPSLRVGFVVRNTKGDFPELEGIRINASRYYSSAKLTLINERIKFLKKACELCEKDAITMLASAKAHHDELERIYVNAMDIDSLNKKSVELIDEIVSEL